MTSGYKERYRRYFQAVEAALPGYLPREDVPQKTVSEAMAYSLLGGGKRLRAVLCLAFCELSGGRAEDAMPFACSIEMVHCYSLIHDDLPCMDDDDMRRGKPSCHVKYGEAMAVLAGDGLLTLGFETMLHQTGKLPPERAIKAAAALADAIGSSGMIGGQVIDIESEGKEIGAEALTHLHRLKTGALIRASARMGCILAGAEEALLRTADEYAGNIGLAFQITDDILDVTASQETLGKPIGSDKEQGKTTFVTLFGLERSRQLADELTEKAISCLEGTPLDDPFLRDLALELAKRDR